MTATPGARLGASLPFSVTGRLLAPLAPLVLFTVLAGARVAQAQLVRSAPFVELGSDADERLRLSQLLGTAAGDGYLIRSASTLTATVDSTDAGGGARSAMFGVLLPQGRVIRNSGIPYSLDDGSLWAGRGWNREVTFGAVARYGPVRLIIAPTVTYSENTAFQVIPYPQTGADPRNVWANPFHPLPESIDLPLRFGDQPLQRTDPGQSSLAVDAGPVSFGAGTENLWWGPGIRNAIVLSDNAPGFPHAFVQTRRPLRTGIGTFDAQWIVGQLTESDFFDSNPDNNKRSLAGAIGTWSPSFDSTLTLGLSRIVMATESGTAFPLGAAFDVLRSGGHLDTELNTPVPSTARDQISSVFGRYLLPSAGFEAYAEWARFEEPLSLEDFLEYPGHSEGYTLGFQWAHPFAGGAALRIQSEASYLEPDPSLRTRPVAITYTSRGVPQGFTNRGETLGAAIGPGASSQWLAGDWLAARWRFGVELERIRWDNGVLYEPIVPEYKRPDVTMLAGLRAGVRWRGADVLVDFAHAARFNYLFQDYVLGVGERYDGIDLINNTLSVTLSLPIVYR